MALDLRKYEAQAKLSVALGAAGTLGILFALWLLCRNFDGQNFWVAYSTQSFYLPSLGLGLLVALLAGTVGFFVGLNSAGQRRNTRSRLAWQGFFLNAVVITAAVSAGIFFVLTRYPVNIE